MRKPAPGRLSISDAGLRRWLRIVALAVLVAGVAYFLNRVVQSEARQLTQSEISAVAEQAVAEAESAIGAAAKTLADLGRTGRVDCLRETVARLRDGVARTPIIASLNLVDSNGFLMCSTSTEVMEDPAQLLPELTPRMPPITISTDPRPGRPGLLVSWTAASGTRLVAKLVPDVPRIPAGPALTRGRLNVTLSVADRLWRASGDAPTAPTEKLTARATGTSFPVTADVAIAAAPIPQQFRDIGMAIKIAAAAVVGALIGFGWFGLGTKRRSAAGPAANKTRATLAYRPVIEITSGTIVGIDAVAEGANDATVADIHFVDRVLTEIAPILRVHPTLKLSLPSISDPRALAGLAAALSRAMPRFSVLPAQVVVAAMPRPDEATSRALESVRAAGVRVSIDGIATGGAALMALGNHKPDFITIGGELASGPDSGTNALTILEALVELARRLDVGVIMRDVAEMEQIERLRGVGITTATGSAFGPALKAHLISSLVAAATLDAEKRVRVA